MRNKPKKLKELRSCFLCGKKIPKPIEDFYCYGCEYYICDDHHGVVFGHGHKPEDHDREEE